VCAILGLHHGRGQSELLRIVQDLRATQVV
jgi:hypothetical protein